MTHSEQPSSSCTSQQQLTPYILGFVAFAALYFFMLGSHGLMEPDEGRYAQIPYEMVQTGDWVTPRQNGVLYFEKPALHYWLTAVAFKVFGFNEFAARFWPALLGLLSLPVVFFLGERMYGNRRAGGIAAAVLGTSLLHFALAHVNLTDMTLSFFTLLAVAGLWLAGEHRRWLLLFYSGMALALLSKGLVGVVLPCGIAFWYIVLTRQWSLIRRYLYLPGIALFFAISVPWFWIVSERNPDFFYFLFIHEHFLRYTTQIHNRYEPIWFFIPILIAALVPWAGWLPSTLRFVKSSWGEQKKTSLFLLCWCFVIFVFYSVSSSKLIPYILPCLPPLALLIGGCIENALARENTPLLRRGFIENGSINALLALAFWVYPFLQHRIPQNELLPIGIALGFSLLAGSALPLLILRRSPQKSVGIQLLGAFLFCLFALPLFGVVAQDRSAKELARFIEKRLPPGDLLAEYATFDQGLPFYLNRRLALVDYKGELEFGSQFPEADGWFFTKKSFNEFKKTRGVLLVMEKKRLESFFDHQAPSGAIVEYYGKYATVYFPMNRGDF